MIGDKNCFKIEQWRYNIEKNGCSIKSIKDLFTLHKRNGEHLFSLLDVDVREPDNRKLPNIVFIRGNAVIVVPLLINESSKEKKFLMVTQRRIGSGELSLEFPAGMIDREDETPIQVGKKELLEETGLEVDEKELFPLLERPLYSSAGASDEAIFFFGCIKKVPSSVFESFYTTHKQNQNENEYIKTELLSKEEAISRITSLQAYLSLFLFELKSNLYAEF